MKIDALVGAALLGAIAIPAASQAGTLRFNFTGPDVAGSLSIVFTPSSNQGTLPSTSPNSVNPVGSYSVTGASGTFMLGSASEGVTGVAGLNRATPEPGNDLAPYDFSLFTVTDGVDDGQGHVSPGLHYDNLLYSGGSPQTASDYPFSGGIFDIYGLVFSLGNGDFVNIWSNGVTPGGLDYGVAVTDGKDVLAYTNGVSLFVVPLPASAPMFGAALLAVGVAGYGLRRKQAAAT